MDRADQLARLSGLDTMVGRPSTIWVHQKIRRGVPDLPTAFTALEERFDAWSAGPQPEDEPLFIFSAGWRSGSTLLQRLVVSAHTHFIWGEPYHQSDAIRRLAESLVPFGTGWPPERYVYGTPAQTESSSDELSSQWLANFYPPMTSLIEAHRSFVRQLLAPPESAADMGWGLKEVRLSADYALYLHLLFPRARFIFLVRDPLKAYRSYRERPSWFERWPRSQVRTPYAYGQLWRRIAESFLTHEQRLGATLLRYEDIVAGGEAVDRLEAVLGAPVDRSVLEKRMDSTGGRSGSGPSALELAMLGRAVGPAAARLGYANPRAAAT